MREAPTEEQSCRGTEGIARERGGYCAARVYIPPCFGTNQLRFILQRQSRSPGESAAACSPGVLQRLDLTALALLSSSVISRCALPVCLFAGGSLVLIYTVIPVCTGAGGSNTRLVLCMPGRECSCVARRGRGSQPALCHGFALQVRAGPPPLPCSSPGCSSTFLCRNQCHRGGKGERDPGVRVQPAASFLSLPLWSSDRLKHREDS